MFSFVTEHYDYSSLASRGPVTLAEGEYYIFPSPLLSWRGSRPHHLTLRPAASICHARAWSHCQCPVLPILGLQRLPASSGAGGPVTITGGIPCTLPLWAQYSSQAAWLPPPPVNPAWLLGCMATIWLSAAFWLCSHHQRQSQPDSWAAPPLPPAWLLISSD